MANMLKSAFVAFLVVVALVGCANMQQPIPQQQPYPPQQRPVMHQTAVAQAPTSMQVTAVFPTSKNAPQGKPWGTMHVQGFTGGYDVACNLLLLTHTQCVMYQEMHSRGACQIMEVPNGVVLDRLTFTRNGKHQVDHGALVALKNPPSRTTEVCDLGGGVVAMRFHGCNNHGIVRGWNPPRPAPVVVKPAVCSGQKLLRINVWEPKAVMIPGVSQAISAAHSGGHFASDRVSRGFGGKFLSENASGNLRRSAVPHTVVVSILKPNGGRMQIYTGTVIGEYTLPMPQGFVDGDVMEVVFTDPTRVVSPQSELRAAYAEFRSPARCETVRNNLHAIER